MSQTFSGPIPQAEDLHKYTGDQQERILRMAEAPRTDESERRTMITQAGISSNRRASVIQPVLFLICVGTSAFFFWNDKEIAGAVFLGYPVLSFLSGVRWNLSRRRRTKTEDEV
jgi:hypothetical protein